MFRKITHFSILIFNLLYSLVIRELLTILDTLTLKKISNVFLYAFNSGQLSLQGEAISPSDLQVLIYYSVCRSSRKLST